MNSEKYSPKRGVVAATCSLLKVIHNLSIKAARVNTSYWGLSNTEFYWSATQHKVRCYKRQPRGIGKK